MTMVLSPSGEKAAHELNPVVAVIFTPATVIARSMRRTVNLNAFSAVLSLLLAPVS
jgi:hypothetical protein